jgi:acetolactate synthase I/II/III large subunit
MIRLIHRKSHATMSSPEEKSTRRTVAVAIAEALQRHGIEVIFSQSLPSALLLAAGDLGIRAFTYRTENAGAAMADGYARISGRTTVVTAQNGPAATLLVPGLAEALKSSVPVVALVQDVNRLETDRNAFQDLDHFALFSSCAKWVRRVTEPARAIDYVDMAFTAATSGRPGPAVLMLPADLLLQPCTGDDRRGADLGRFPLDRSHRPPTA